MKSLFITLIAFAYISASAQFDDPFYYFNNDVIPDSTETELLLNQNCTRISDAYINYYRHKENYIPQSGSIIKNIKINLHVFQKNDGTGNWQNIPNHLDTLNLFF